MLAFMQQSPPLSDLHPPSTVTTSTMSVAILPSAPITYGQAPTLGSAPSPSKRPKLSLDTAALPSTFGGKRSTSLRLETLSAISPTVRNTFSNAYHPESQSRLNGPKAKRPALSFLSTTTLPPAVARKDTPTEKAAPDSEDSLSTSAASSTSASTFDYLPTAIPYKLSYSIPSILANGPILRSASQRRSMARSMFPHAKKVSFRAPLTEDIKTEKYTLRHSDIDSSTSTISTLELPPPKFGKDGTTEAEENQSHEIAQQNTISQPSTGEKRESSDEDDSDTGPATPVAGRRKRHRQWVWTLGPVESTKQATETEKCVTSTEKTKAT